VTADAREVVGNVDRGCPVAADEPAAMKHDDDGDEHCRPVLRARVDVDVLALVRTVCQISRDFDLGGIVDVRQGRIDFGRLLRDRTIEFVAENR
jgi:hypothetical protein